MKKQKREVRSQNQTTLDTTEEDTLQVIAQTLGTQISQLVVWSARNMLRVILENQKQSIISIHTPQFDSLLTASDMARVLKISRAKVYQILQGKEIPCFSMGRTVRVHREDLETFIQKHTA